MPCRPTHSDGDLRLKLADVYAKSGQGRQAAGRVSFAPPICWSIALTSRFALEAFCCCRADSTMRR